MLDNNLLEQLVLLREESYNNKNYELVVQTLQDLGIDGIIREIIYTTPNELITQITSILIQILQDIYNNGGIPTEVSDDDYDKLYAYNLKATGEDIIGAPVTKNLVYHKYPQLRGTLDKIHFIRDSEKLHANDNRDSMEDFLRKTQNRLKKPIKDYSTRMVASIKFDGCSAIIECDQFGIMERALTRGFTKDNSAEDLTDKFKWNPDFAWVVALAQESNHIRKPFGLKVEVVMTEVQLNDARKIRAYKDRRSAVAGILNKDDPNPKLLKCITPMPLQFVYDDEEVPSLAVEYRLYTDAFDFERQQEIIDELQAVAESSGIPADGVVFRFTDPDLVKDLGRDNSINNYEVAYKFPVEIKKTTIKHVEFNIGPMGNLSATAKIEPLIMNHRTVKSVTCGGIDNLMRLNLHVGDEVMIKYDIVPYIYKDETCKEGIGPQIIAPKLCPLCNSYLEKDPMLKCVNKKCIGRQIGKILNYTNKLNILEISSATITDFVNAGILKNIEDLYNLKSYKNIIASLDGYGEPSARLIINSIMEKTDYYDYEVLGALGINGVGQRKFNEILKIYPFEKLMTICYEGNTVALMSVKGVSDVTAKKVIEGIRENYETIKCLKRVLKIRADERKFTANVVFTGVRDHLFEKHLESKMNVKVESGVKRGVTHLIVESVDANGKPTHISGKVEKAMNLGIKILSIDEAYKLFKYM